MPSHGSLAKAGKIRQRPEHKIEWKERRGKKFHNKLFKRRKSPRVNNRRRYNRLLRKYNETIATI